MSGVIKGVKKVFKKVTNVAKKVLPAALAIGAIYFTAGSALGIAGTAGGWGAAVSSLTSKLGATGILGQVLTGAVTQAGYGAALGGGLSLLTGGDPMKGMQTGAIGGAVTGAATGALGFGTDPLSGMSGEPTAAGQPGSGGVAPSQTGTNLGPVSLDPKVNGYVPPAATAAAAPVSAPAAVAPTGAPAASGGGLMPWLERNQTLVGNAIGGLGQGLMAMGQGQDRTDAARIDREREADQRAAIAANYGSGNVQGFTPAAAPAGNPTPVERFDPRMYDGSYQYDAKSGRVVYVPNATA